MKVSEMNARQKKAFYNIYHAANWIIGGLENALQDHLPEDDAYKKAEATLTDHDGLVELLFKAAISERYDDGGCSFNPSAERYLRDIRFCGKDFLMERCEARIKKMGY